MSSTTSPQVSRSRLVHEELAIVNWPLRDELLLAWPLIGAKVACSILVAVVAESLAMGILSLAALVIAGWRLWIPVRFELGPHGIAQRVFGRRRRLPWHQIGGFRARRRGVLILPPWADTPLSAFRGVFIGWNGKRDELLATLEHYLARRPSLPDSKSQWREARPSSARSE